MSGLSDPIAFFGIHSCTPYQRTNGQPYGILKVLAGSTLAISSSLVKLTGGSSKYPWAAEDGPITAEMTWKVSEYPDFMFQLFGGLAPTGVAGDTLGYVSTLTNKLGTSCMKATTGIASVQIKTGSETDIKFGKYLVVVKTSTTVDVYLMSDVDPRGTSVPYIDDSLKVASALTVTTLGVTTDITGCGVQLVGGSGTIGMTVGDTATFETRPINTKSSSVVLGSLAHSYPEFGAVMLGQKRGNGMMVEIETYRVKQSAGLPIDLSEAKFSQASLKMDLLYDQTQDGVARVRKITAP